MARAGLLLGDIFVHHLSYHIVVTFTCFRVCNIRDRLSIFGRLILFYYWLSILLLLYTYFIWLLLIRLSTNYINRLRLSIDIAYMWLVTVTMTNILVTNNRWLGFRRVTDLCFPGFFENRSWVQFPVLVPFFLSQCETLASIGSTLDTDDRSE